MPSVTIPLLDIEQIVVRPSVYQVIDQVRDILGMTKDAEIIYAGKRGTVRATGSAMSELGSDNVAKFTSDDYISIEVLEDYDVEAVQEFQVHSWDNFPIFSDPKLNVSLRPIYLTSKMEITFSYQSTSETEVRQWLTNQITKASRGRDINIHHIVYSYPIPLEFLCLLDEVHQRREANEGYGETLLQYFDKHRVSRVTSLVNQAGEKAIPVVREKQGQILGTFDFTVMPEKPEFVKEKGVWTTRFVYRYSYQRPDAVFLHYPIAIHNDFLPEAYLERPQDVIDYDTRNSYYSHGMNALNHFALGRPNQTLRSPSPFLNIPDFDTFHPKVKAHTATIFIARCFLDEGKQDLLSLHELGDYEIDPDILTYLVSETAHLLKPWTSIFLVEHYKNGELQTGENIEITPELMIRSKTPLSMRDSHHVRLAILPEVNQALYPAMKRMGEFPAAFTKVVASFFPILRLDPDFGSLSGYKSIEDWQLNAVYRIITLLPTAVGTPSLPNGALAHPTVTYSPKDIDRHIQDIIYTDKNTLNLLTGLHPSKIKDFLMNYSKMPQRIASTAIIAKRN